MVENDEAERERRKSGERERERFIYIEGTEIR